MGWSTKAPSGVSWTKGSDTGTIKNNYYNYWGETSFARGKNNTVYVRVVLCAQLYSYEYRLIAPSPEMRARITGWGAGSATDSSVYAAARPAFGATVTVKTLYWTGTAAPNATCSVQISNTSDYSGRATLKAPAYTSKYTVTFNRNGGSGGTASVTAAYGSAMPGITVPTRTGYAFQGYFDSTSGGNRYYNANGTSARTCTLSANTTLYAQWTANSYTVTLDSRGGSGGTETVTATFDAAMPAITVPTRTGYTFGGYYTGTDGTGTQYYSAAGTSANNWGLGEDTTLCALWTANTYTVSFDSMGGSACGSMTATYGSPYGTLPTPERTNYTFTGWFTQAEGGTQVTASTVAAITADQTLYARWTLNAVRITYYGNGAGASGIPAPQDKLIGDTAVISSAVPTRTGYTFLRWNTQPNGSGTDYSGGDTYSTDEPLGLYAQWAAVPTVSEVTAVRCDSTGTTTDTEADTFAVIGFRWATDAAVTGVSYTIRWVNRENAQNAGSTSGTLSGTTGTVEDIVCGAASGGAAAIETAYQYDITITVTDSNGGAGTDTDFVSRAYYVMDFTPGGRGIGLGSPAADGRITTGLPHRADAEERGTRYEQIVNATDAVLLRELDWDGNETLLGSLSAGGEITDGAGNMLSEKAESADTYTKAEVDALILASSCQVGDIFLSTVSTSPAARFGGSWERITGRFLLGTDTTENDPGTYPAGSTGGEAEHTLTADESGQKALTITGGGHSHSVKYRNDLNTATSGSNRRFGPYADASSGSQYSPVGTSSESHTHWVSASDAASAHNNMPPYLAVYVWRRIA